MLNSWSFSNELVSARRMSNEVRMNDDKAQDEPAFGVSLDMFILYGRGKTADNEGTSRKEEGTNLSMNI